VSDVPRYGPGLHAGDDREAHRTRSEADGGGGKRESLLVKLHPEVALHLLEEEKDFLKKLEKAVSFPLELRDDPMLRPDEFSSSSKAPDGM
jgi:hypothetical protein